MSWARVALVFKQRLCHSAAWPMFCSSVISHESQLNKFIIYGLDVKEILLFANEVGKPGVTELRNKALSYLAPQ